MSALTPHIRVLRAEADAIDQAAVDWVDNAPIALMFSIIATAKRNAADALEAEDAALKPPRDGLDQPIHYDPKGKV